MDTADQVGWVADWAIIDGWIPTPKTDQFRTLLKEERYCLTPAEESGLEFSCVPTLFRRPAALDGFASLIKLYGTTGYRELDPSPLLAITFSLMFGMMFADLGQGALLALLGLWLYNRPQSWDNRWHQAGLVLIPVGCSAAFFGLLFGNVFAREDWIPPLIHHPMNEIFVSLGISVLIGVGMLCLGMAIGLFNAWRGARLRQLYWSDYGPLGLVFYLALVVLSLCLWQEWTQGARVAGGLALAVLALVMANRTFAERQQPLGLRLFQALLETWDFVIKFVVQTLSFVRLAAFTFAHIALSMALLVVVDLVSGIPWLAWALFILGNLLITLVEGVLVAIQVIRLHFFELFTKFTSGEGCVFTPLRPTRTTR
nr:V-type ATPase 116kDa subunit family protein [Motiliproteus sp. SC1-56]